MDEAEVDRGSMAYPLHSSSTHNLHYTGVHPSHHCYCIHPSWSSSAWLGFYYDTKHWVYGARILVFTPLQPTPSPPHLQELRIAPHLYLVPHLPLPPANLVSRVPKHHLPSHRAPQTNMWSLNMTVNLDKYFQI